CPGSRQGAGRRRQRRMDRHHDSGKGLDRNFCPDCGARLFSSKLESFPGLVFVTLGSLDQPELIKPGVEMFTRRRLAWARPLDLPQVDGMPG
ncbi:GFA family protein, partial [Rhizobium ruizarguesonis]